MNAESQVTLASGGRVLASAADAVDPSPRPAAGRAVADELRAGSRAAMTAVFADHLDTIYNYCYRRSGSWSAAEDLTSAVFLEVWRSRHRVIDLDGSVLPWLYGVATNVCRNHARSQRRRLSALTRLQVLDRVEGEVADRLGDAIAERIDSDRRVRTALDRLATLPPGDQDVFILVCWEGQSYAETARALDLPVGTVRSRLARVRRELRLADRDHADGGRDE